MKREHIKVNKWPCSHSIKNNYKKKTIIMIKLKEHFKNTEKYPQIERNRKV